MVQAVDLYSILLFYANKNNSPFIEIDSFLDYLTNHAKRQSVKYPAWQRWTNEGSLKFWSELPVLVEEGKCQLVQDSDNSRIYMSGFYPELLKKAYQSADQNEDLPFPAEESLKLRLPEDQIKVLNTEYDLVSFMEEPGPHSSKILKINFPEDFGSTLVLASMFPREIMEISILKIRNYLRRYGNKEYTLHKLSPQLQGKESFLAEQLDQIILRPLDLCKAIEGGGDLSYLFWAHFCTLIKSDLRKKKERLSAENAAFQSVCIIEAINGYYKTLATKQREKELAFKRLESLLAKPPFLYPMGEILKFTSPKGALLLNIYSNEELETWLNKMTKEREQYKMPVLLVMQGYAKNELCFLLKEKMLSFCVRLLTDGRFLVKEAVFKDWSSQMMEYKKDRAMESDEEFERLLSKHVEKLCPALKNLLADSKLLLVYHEMELIPNGIPPAARLFDKDKLLPYSALFRIQRRDLLSDVKLTIPFWYSMPLLSAIIGFFKRFLKRNKTAMSNKADSEQEMLEEKDSAGEIRVAAEELEFTLLPPGYTLDFYLEELEDRWSRLIDKDARRNLIEDVRALARGSLRRTLQVTKKFVPTKEKINQMAYDLIIGNKALASMSARDSLLLYLELYIIRLLKV